MGKTMHKTLYLNVSLDMERCKLSLGRMKMRNQIF